MDIRTISLKELQEKKDKITAMLHENLSVSFDEFEIDKNYSEKMYDDILKFKKDGSAILLGAFEHDEIIGFLWAYKRDLFGDKRIHIDEIIVDEKFRGTGIGKQLLLAAEQEAIKSGIKKLDLMVTATNERAVNVYKKDGFEVKRYQMEKKCGE